MFQESGKPSNQSQCGSSSYFETISSQLLEDLPFSNPYQNKGVAIQMSPMIFMKARYLNQNKQL